MTSLSELASRFPALRRLAISAIPRRVPVIRQLASTDCGAAALAMVLKYHGKCVSVGELRSAMGGGRGGSTAQTLLHVARQYGLRGRGVRADIQNVEELPAATILFWEFRHYVVLERVRKGSVDIVDPALGRRSVAMDVFGRCFTGVAVVLEPTDKFQGGGATKTKVAGLLGQVLERRDLLFRLVSVSLLVQLLLLIAPVTMAVLADRVVPRHDYSLLALAATGYIVSQAFGAFAVFVRAHLMIHLQTQIESRFTLRFVDHLASLPYSFFEQRTCGDLMVRLGANTAVRNILTSILLSAWLDGVMACIYLPLLIWLSGPLTGVVLLLAAARICLMIFARWRQQRLLAASIDNQAKSQTCQIEILSCMETLKAMGIEHDAIERWSGVFVDGLNIEVRRGKLNANFGLAMGLLSAVSTLATMFYGTYLVLQGTWTLGTMLAFNAVAAGFLGPVTNIVSAALQLQMAEVYIDRMNDVTEQPPEQEEAKLVPLGPLDGRIRFENVSFRYSAESPFVLQNISLEVPKGFRVVLVGKTGSGKSTLARLIAGLYDPTSGRVLFDENDLKAVDRRSVRNQIGIVTQSADLFSGSIRRNIALSNPEMTFEQVIRSARIACIHDDIIAMGMGYETQLSDRGLTLSGGQRQRVAIARALARNPRVLVFDEATSHLDAVTEARLHRNLCSLRCTTIAVAHRLSTMRDADLIIVLDSGRIVESGSHDQLLALGGKYRELVDAQSDLCYGSGSYQRSFGA